MITKTITTTTGKIQIKIPTSLAEITIGQMIEMQEATGNEIPCIDGLSEDVVSNIVDYTELFEIRERILSLAHQIKYAYESNDFPKEIHIIGKVVKVPHNLNIEPAGAYLNCHNTIATEINKNIELYGENEWREKFTPSLKTCCELLAHYLYCPATGLPYREQLADDFINEVKKMSVKEGLPLARFFMTSYPVLRRRKLTFWQVFLLILKKKQDVRNLRRSNITI